MYKFIPSCSEYALNSWTPKFGSFPIKEIASANWAECYTVDAAHLFELENGKFAFVRESGCSCYSYDDAYIQIYDSLDEAMKNYNKCVKEKNN